jgi:hypothetical protein
MEDPISINPLHSSISLSKMGNDMFYGQANGQKAEVIFFHPFSLDMHVPSRKESFSSIMLYYTCCITFLIILL